MEMRRKDIVEDNECLLLLSAPKIHYAYLLLFLATESDLLPRESEMISVVLRNVVKVEGGKCSLTAGGRMSSERRKKEREGIGCLEEM